VREVSGISDEFTKKYPHIADKIKQQYPDAQIISAQTCHYPLHKQKVRFTVTTIRPADLLEEYVMKAAMLELKNGTDIPLLSRMLGMDEVFLCGCIDDLCDKGILKKDLLPALVLTESGKKHAAASTLPSDEIVDEVEYYIDKKSGTFYTSPIEDASCGNWEYYRVIDEYVENVKKYISRKFICDVGKALGKNIESPDGTTRLTSLVSAKITGQSRTLITDIRLENSNGTRFCLVWDHAGAKWRDDLASVIQKYVEILHSETSD